jgi:hypothetical protein
MSVTLCECAFPAMRKELKYISDGGGSSKKKLKRGYSGAYGGKWRSLMIGGRFGIGTFRRNLSQIAVKMILLLITLK